MFHTSLLVQNGYYNLLIDAGDGIAKALLYAGVKYNEIDAIFITHTHADHFSGLASLLTQMKFTRRKKPLLLFIHSELENFVIDYLRHLFLFPSTFNFKLQIFGYKFGDEIEHAENLKIVPLQNTHIKNKHNIKDISELKFVSASVLLKSNGVKVQYTSDVGAVSDLKLFTKFSPDYFISEATHIPFERIVEHIMQAKYKKSYFVHINNDDKIIEQHRKLSEEKRSKIIITFDGMKVKLT
jgi:ribonuclease BN (tRNA processing enzyme)